MVEQPWRDFHRDIPPVHVRLHFGPHEHLCGASALMSQPFNLKTIGPWKLWCPGENFAKARAAANAAGFQFDGVPQSLYDSQGYEALYGDDSCGNSLSYSRAGHREFFERETSTEVYLWSDGSIQPLPEVAVPSMAPGIKSLPTRRAWLQGRLSAVADAISASALNNENVPFEWERELSDLISEIRKLPKT